MRENRPKTKNHNAEYRAYYNGKMRQLNNDLAIG